MAQAHCIPGACAGHVPLGRLRLFPPPGLGKSPPPLYVRLRSPKIRVHPAVVPAELGDLGPALSVASARALGRGELPLDPGAMLPAHVGLEADLRLQVGRIFARAHRRNHALEQIDVPTVGQQAVRQGRVAAARWEPAAAPQRRRRRLASGQACVGSGRIEAALLPGAAGAVARGWLDVLEGHGRMGGGDGGDSFVGWGRS